MARESLDRDLTSGKFVAGNRGGPGNPHARRVARLRAELLRSMTPRDVRQVIEALIAEAKGGSVPAARELLDRVIGRPLETDILERLEMLEVSLAGKRSGDINEHSQSP